MPWTLKSQTMNFAKKNSFILKYQSIGIRQCVFVARTNGSIKKEKM